MDYKRDDSGRFAEGNRGGPGRPPRAVEADYLQTLADAVDLDAWRAIVDRAVTDAQGGDKSAREWLTKYLVGAGDTSLLELAIQEALGVKTAHRVEVETEIRLEEAKDDWSPRKKPENMAILRAREERGGE